MVAVSFTTKAEEDLASLDRNNAQRMLKKIRWLAENFEAVQPEPLTGQWAGVNKLRVGDYRILYTVVEDPQKIVIHVIRHRREVYKS